MQSLYSEINIAINICLQQYLIYLAYYNYLNIIILNKNFQNLFLIETQVSEKCPFYTTYFGESAHFNVEQINLPLKMNMHLKYKCSI